ncbi:MAG: aldehyde dehydrogenase family protein [Actinomycetota bacterium]|jgi:aldehyde dehydrogenase (NAD+)|nr:aldehyde dehydrogenase family protein [Actinomycetota bacterium]
MSTTVHDAPSVVAALRATFDAGLTRPLSWRRQQLLALKRMLADGEDELLAAMRADLGKPAVEARLTDLSFVDAEIDVMLRHLESWARPERAGVPLAQQPGRATIIREPLGVALVVAPWNYPVQLLLVPMAAALAAGNCVVGKPSEIAAATSAAIARLVPRHLDDRAVSIIEGGPDETRALLEQRFDTIFYTGNGRVGRIVMEAAAKHLTPVTLELGGKSPVLVGADADLDVAARRIAWGKFLNAGQTCVAPDYVLVDERVEPALVDALRRTIGTFYGSDPQRSGDYARIVSDRHFERLTGLLAATSGTVVLGGEHDKTERYLAPTVVTGVSGDDPLMDDEIFGPILPVLRVAGMEEAVKFVSSRPKPLALYVFSSSNDTVDLVVSRTSSGSVGVNLTLQQVAVPQLPFGGVGQSGMGAYHGRQGFETFSHRRAVLAKPTRVDPPVQYPPYTKLKGWLLKKML